MVHIHGEKTFDSGPPSAKQEDADHDTTRCVAGGGCCGLAYIVALSSTLQVGIGGAIAHSSASGHFALSPLWLARAARSKFCLILFGVSHNL